MLLLSLFTAGAACPTGPTNNSALQRQVESAFFAFVELDDQGFAAYRQQAVQSVFCLDELIHPHLAAEFLRLEGVNAFTEKNEPFASAAFRNALALEPTHKLPSTMAPAGGPLHTLYTASASFPPTAWTLPEGDFRAYVNGVPAKTVLGGISIIQFVRPDGRLPYSGVVTHSGDLPASLISSLQGGGKVGPLPPFRPVSDGATGRSPRGALLATALLVGLGAGAAYGGSIWMNGRYTSAPTKARRSTTNALFIGAAGLGAVTVTVGITGLATRSKKKRSLERQP